MLRSVLYDGNGDTFDNLCKALHSQKRLCFLSLIGKAVIMTLIVLVYFE